MSMNDNLRVLKSSALQARRDHIARTLGGEAVPSASHRLAGLQRMLPRLERALSLTPRTRNEEEAGSR
ncbi:hypothetical protein [Pseudoroseomonas sp. WGS1072]|uniref:hypothetical protein n=1 Tax=Roseomonas sp. WGS1072 TaxID=3366816 RepID=UPI003BEFEEB2